MIDGKKYIGKTKHFKERMSQHKRSKTTYLGRAFIKYGLKNFSFEIIDEAESYKELKDLESKYQILENCIRPNGYNLSSSTDQLGFIHPETILKRITKRATKNKHRLRGVTSNNGKTRCGFMHNGKRYGRSFDSVVEAGEYFDIAMLFLHGENAVVNFPEKIPFYKESRYYKQMGSYLDLCSNRKKIRRCSGAYFEKGVNKWTASLSFGSKTFRLGYFKSQRAAMLLRDIGVLYHELDLKLNFPALEWKIKPSKVSYLYFKFLYIRKGKKGITYNRKEKKWIAKAPTRENPKRDKHLGYFKTENEAVRARNLAIENLNK